MSLADRRVTAKKEEEQKNKIADGEYSVRLKDWKFGKSKGGKDMYTLTWKILKKLNPGKKEDATADKGKERRTFYLPSYNWSIVALLDLIEGMGANLEAMEEYSEIDDVMEEVEDTKMPKATMALEHEEGKQHPNIEIKDIEKVLKPKKEEKKKASTKKPVDDDDDDDDDDDVAVPD